MKHSIGTIAAALLLTAALAGCSDSASSAPAASGSEAASQPVSQAASSAPAVEQNDAQNVTPTGKVVRPLPLTVDIADLGDCTVGASVEPDGIFLDDTGRAQMTVTLYDYDLYDMVDVAALEPGDVMEYHGSDLLVNSVERLDSGLVRINGGLELGGFDLSTDDGTVYYECGFDDVKYWLALGTVTLPVNEEFTFVDASDLEKDAEVWYVGDFLTPGAALPDDLTPYNTTVTIQDGQVLGMYRIFVP